MAYLPPSTPHRLVLVVSDLHMAAGADPDTGRIDSAENFFADDAFARFLDHHLPREEGPPGPLLVLDGDIFDFLRITGIPVAPEDFARWRAALDEIGYRPKVPLEQSLVKKERRYGLRTDDYKTVWKFREIAEGHPGFFAGLGRWTARGGRIAILKGNHDLELHWPLVHSAIRAEIARHAGFPLDEQAVSFHEDGFQVGNLYIEHGHRFEAMTRVKGKPTIYRGEEIRYPFGSFFNKYVINQLEGLEPFLDNVKPTSKMVQAVIRKHPLASVRIILHGLRALRPVLWRDSFKNGMAMLILLLTLGLPVLIAAVAILAFIFEPVRTWISGVIGNSAFGRAVTVLAAALPWIVAGVKELFRRHRHFAHGEDDYGEGMYEVATRLARGWSRFYAVVGHTHRMDVQDLGVVDGCRCMYLNSGSWAPRWDDNRPDLTGRVEYSFLRFTLHDREYRPEVLEWRDERGRPVPATILGGRRR